MTDSLLSTATAAGGLDGRIKRLVHEMRSIQVPMHKLMEERGRVGAVPALSLVGSRSCDC